MSADPLIMIGVKRNPAPDMMQKNVNPQNPNPKTRGQKIVGLRHESG
jgi:hypothetical protein